MYQGSFWGYTNNGPWIWKRLLQGSSGLGKSKIYQKDLAKELTVAKYHSIYTAQRQMEGTYDFIDSEYKAIATIFDDIDATSFGFRSS